MAAVVIVSAVAASINTLISVLNRIGSYTKENEKLSGEYTRGLEFLMTEMNLAHSDLVEWEGQSDSLSVLLEEILLDLDDYLAELAKPGNFVSAYIRAVAPIAETVAAGLISGLTVDTRPRQIQDILGYLERMKSILARKTPSVKKDIASRLPEPPALAPIPSCPVDSDLDNGFRARLIKLKELISPDRGNLRRICIVGCRGVGKSCLARKLFEAAESPDIAEICMDDYFDCMWWIDASRCKKVDDLLDQLIKCSESISSVPKTFDAVHNFLLEKRYLIVIDDLCSGEIKWKDLKQAFPDNRKDSRILVITTDLSVSREYCSASYFIYHLRCLSDSNSKELFWRRIINDSSRPVKAPSEPAKRHSEDLLAKCQGLPSVLMKAVEYLCSGSNHGFLSRYHTEELSAELSNLATTNKVELQDLKRVFLHCYSQLQDLSVRNCLLYFSLYPQGFKIGLKNLARKLRAESLVDEKQVEKCLNDLVDMSMVMRDDNRYQLQGMMLEFAICKALARNFVTLVDKGKVRLNKFDQNFLVEPKCRRLAIHGCNRCVVPQDINMSNVRSLTIIGSADPAHPTSIDEFKFESFKFMRVLELAGCQGFQKNNTFRSICELRLLKFLNLEKTDVSIIPKEIENLKKLETLDMSNTEPQDLPIQALTLPELVYLFGVFLIPSLGDRESSNVAKFLSTQSKLHTLEGLHISDTSAFDLIIRNATNLKRIKLCEDMYTVPRVTGFFTCFSAQPSKEAILKTLVKSLHSRRQHLDSIFIESGNISRAFLNYSMAGSTLERLKLMGRLANLPSNELHSMSCLSQISLYGTYLSCEAIVDGLQSLPWLERLKLGKEYTRASWGGVFHVRADQFQSLRELCFKGPHYLPQVVIEEGGMINLEFLKLLCPYEPADDSDMNILAETMDVMVVGTAQISNPALKILGLQHLQVLDAINLHHSAPDAMVTMWEMAAKAHTNMPSVTRQGKQGMHGANDF